ncbi:hypothetical protein Tco_1047780 [Tanacetum coccineum]
MSGSGSCWLLLLLMVVRVVGIVGRIVVGKKRFGDVVEKFRHLRVGIRRARKLRAGIRRSRNLVLVVVEHAGYPLLVVLVEIHFGHEGPSEIRNTINATLRLIFNAFKALEVEKLAQTYTMLKNLLHDLEKKDVSIPQAEGQRINRWHASDLVFKVKVVSMLQVLVVDQASVLFVPRTSVTAALDLLCRLLLFTSCADCCSLPLVQTAAPYLLRKVLLLIS